MKNGIMLTPWLDCELAGGDERRHRAGLVDAFLENLPVDRLAVVEHVVGIDRLVELADVRVDAELAEEGLHAEGAGLVGHDRHDVAADVLVAHQPHQEPHEGHRGGDLAAVAAGEELGEVLPLRRLQLASSARGGPARSRPAPCGARGDSASPGCRRAACRTRRRRPARRRSECRTGGGTRAVRPR